MIICEIGLNHKGVEPFCKTDDRTITKKLIVMV